MDVLRPSLLPGLIHSLRHNVTRKNYDVALFEIGRVFLKNNNATKEERRVAIALTVLGFNLLGDGLRDALDPRLRNS